MKKTNDVKVTLLEKVYDIKEYPYTRCKQSKKISKEKQEDEEKQKIVRKVAYVGWAMGVIIQRRTLLHHNNFMISAKLDDIEKYRRVNGESMRACNSFDNPDEELTYSEPLMPDVSISIKYL